MRKKFWLLVVVAVMLVLGGCGKPSKEDVMKKLSNKWNDTKGYELNASMEIKTGAEPRVYDVEVWHTKPEFYKVHVTQSGNEESQMIVRNEEGVFVITPSIGKTYKFQSDWPAQNSQGYLIGTLAEDMKADKTATMEEKEKEYVFETATRNNHKTLLPKQKIHIDKKTLLPNKVTIHDEAGEEKISIKFAKISLGVEHKVADYKVEMDKPKAESDQAESDEEAKEDSAKEETNEETNEETDHQTYYPAVNWEGTTLSDEQIMKTENGQRILMTFSGEKEYIVIQEPATKPMNQLPVSIEGDPVDLGFAVAALTEQSIQWEVNGVAFFVASDTLSKEELLTVANSMTVTESK
ncbi:outer membrane lipoprotein carrier protein LolA [Sporosarcina sp. PTS2304]|uniref:LolA family protein n=1 Tax=Sporosarcina sp. PTS2304 TaxID=2283194 RepID=UPI000E0D970D|nr:outer membrane lipoprotein carrier protein LolA [Sporosarcina sp. PTS2304]AXI00285.1 outer membrane lipoprotein carrier protein LolA [Sporosarcina sp. PTS2304]